MGYDANLNILVIKETILNILGIIIREVILNVIARVRRPLSVSYG